MRRGRAVLPSLRGDREEEKQGLERQATGKKRKKKRRTHLVSPPPFAFSSGLSRLPPLLRWMGWRWGALVKGARILMHEIAHVEVPLPLRRAPARQYWFPLVPYPDEI